MVGAEDCLCFILGLLATADDQPQRSLSETSAERFLTVQCFTSARICTRSRYCTTYFTQCIQQEGIRTFGVVGRSLLPSSWDSQDLSAVRSTAQAFRCSWLMHAILGALRSMTWHLHKAGAWHISVDLKSLAIRRPELHSLLYFFHTSALRWPSLARVGE